MGFFREAWSVWCNRYVGVERFTVSTVARRMHNVFVSLILVATFLFVDFPYYTEGDRVFYDTFIRSVHSSRSLKHLYSRGTSFEAELKGLMFFSEIVFHD